MNCRDVSNQLTAYLDDEVSASEKKLIQAHLATCKSCQNELELLEKVKKDLRQHLRTRTTSITPSPQAWATLQASIPSTPPTQSTLEKALRSISFPRRLSMGGFSAQRIGIILLTLVILIAVAPPVWARIQPMITNWFSFSSADGKSEAAIGGFTAFTPYHATYLPKDFQHSLIGSTTSIEPAFDSIEIGYDSQEQFITLVQTKGEGLTELPSGETSNVNGLLATFVPSFATSQEEMMDKRPDVSIVTNYSYEATNLFSWFMGEIKIEMFSNLSHDEMLKIAESLETMQGSIGEAPDHED